MRRSGLPVMIGRKLKKGILAVRNARMGGFDLVILWLNKECETGEVFALDDINKIDTIIHFCDESSVDQTIKALKWMKKSGFGKEKTENEQTSG